MWNGMVRKCFLEGLGSKELRGLGQAERGHWGVGGEGGTEAKAGRLEGQWEGKQAGYRGAGLQTAREGSWERKWGALQAPREVT